MATVSINNSTNSKFLCKLQNLFMKYFNCEYLKFLIFDVNGLAIVAPLILLAELALNTFIIERVPYTEIDWLAYMQECEGFLNGTTNYALLKGDTGPLVYPAGFLYIYSLLYYVTARGQNIHLAQYIFAILYLLQLWLVLRLYIKSRKIPPYVLIISIFTSYRIHSIYVLRLFNDPMGMLFLYAALNLFVDGYWCIGSLCFSLGVACKMNVLLFAPALLLFYIINLGYWWTFMQLGICGGIQLLLGAPFLLTHPWHYLKASFDLGRVFEHKWTVNYRFLPRDYFENQYFHIALLIIHIAMLMIFAKPCVRLFQSYVRLRNLQKQLQPQLDRQNLELQSHHKAVSKTSRKARKILNQKSENITTEQAAFLKNFELKLRQSNISKSPQIEQRTADDKVSINFDQCIQLALLPFFLCNFVGILCARSLHYQFYIWYFHSLPYLTWTTCYSKRVRFLLLGVIEFCWNTYPSTNYSSIALHICHIVLLSGVAVSLCKMLQLSTRFERGKYVESGQSDSSDVGCITKLSKKSKQF